MSHIPDQLMPGCPFCGNEDLDDEEEQQPQLDEDFQHLSDMRALDTWRAAGAERKFEEFDFMSTEETPRRIFVFAIETSNEPVGRFARACYQGATPAAARALAAAWALDQGK